MLRKQTPRARKSVSATRVELSLDLRLVLIDQVPLRKNAEKEAKAGMKTMAKFRAELEEFENKVLPEFQRWESSTFGALLTEERELVARLAHLDELINQVSMESFFRGCHQHEAYALIMADRERAERRSEERRSDDDPFDGPDEMEDEDDDLSPDERNFHEFLRGALGVDPEFLHPSEYDRMFHEFQRMAGGDRGKTSHGGLGEHRPAPPPDKSSRVKELYRILARRLHPDSYDSDASVSGLWHDLQDAYARGDVERMEILLAITDLHEGTDGSRTTLFHMRQVAREFARAVAALKKRLSQAKKTSAWKFRDLASRAVMEIKIRSELNRKLRCLREDVASQQALVDRWKKTSAPRPPTPPRKKPTRQPPPMPGQGNFDF